MASYDPSVIVKFSDRLYSQSRCITFVHGFVGFLIGTGLSFIFILAVPPARATAPIVWLICAGFCALVGAAHGHEKGFELRLKAQTALCQLQIESHLKDMLEQITRGASSAC